MRKDRKQSLDMVNNVIPGEVEQFRFMTVRQRLGWLEEANAFVNKFVSREKRAMFDERFNDLPPAPKKRHRKKQD